MKNFNFFRKGVTGLIVLAVFSFVGVEIFQGQKVPPLVNPNIFNYNENDPYIDRPTREALSHVTEKSDDDLDILTDASGFDNFEIGVDFAEQMLVSNPRNPLNMQFGVNNSTTGQNAYFTTDGYTWTSSNPAYHSSICCDPWSAFDSLGRLVYGSGVTGQYVYRSANGGSTYGPAVLSVTGNDRNTLAADQTNGPYTNRLYAAITPGNFSRSLDNGVTWTNTYTPSNTVPGVMIAVGPNGATQGGCVIYVTNTGVTENVTYTFHRSLDGGATFAVRSSLTTAGYVGTLNTAGRLVINNGRTRPYPMIAMDNSYGPHRGRLYLVYASNVPAGNGNKPDVRLRYSDDQAATWSAAVTVNDNASPSLSDQWFPSIWCEKETGRLYIKWYDTRENAATYATNVYATYTDDGGATFATNQKLTTTSWTYPNPVCAANTNCYRGDYDGCTANPKTSFNVWYDGRSGTYKNVGSYFPDFGLLATPASNTIHQTNSSVNFLINIPAVKLYTDVTTFSATVSPLPGTGSIQFEFLGGNTLSSYPNTKYMKAKTVGTVTAGVYTITITGQGSNGTPVHKRTVSLTVNTAVGPVICEDFSGVKFPPASMFDEFSGTEFWSRNVVSAYGIGGTGAAKFDFYNAFIGTVQSLTSNNFPNTAVNTYLTFDEAYAPFTSGGPDTLVVQSSANFGGTYTTLATLLGRVDGTGELNTAPADINPFTPGPSQWRPKIYTLPAGTNKVRLRAKSGFGNNLYVDNICVQVLTPAVSNSFCAIPEGFYRSTPSPFVITDTIRSYLHRLDYPNIVVDSSISYSNISGCMSNLFDKALNGNYYIAWKHRNSIETWTAVSYGYTRGGSFPSLDIINDVSLVFAANEKLVDPTYIFYGMFGGDVLRNDFVDLNDIIAVVNDASVFASGYVQTDLTGDNLTTLNDVIIVYNNASLFAKRKAPAGAEPEPLPPGAKGDKKPAFENDAARQKYESGKNAEIISDRKINEERIQIDKKTRLYDEGRKKLMMLLPQNKTNSKTKGRSGLE